MPVVAIEMVVAVSVVAVLFIAARSRSGFVRKKMAANVRKRYVSLQMIDFNAILIGYCNNLV